jgi:hypothetical protein
MIRVLIIDLMLMIAGAVPAFAEKVTLGCRYDSSRLFYYITINTDAKTVTIAAPGSPLPVTHPAQITDDAVTWYEGDNNTYPNTYDRRTGLFSGQYNYGDPPLPCVRPPAPPF